MGENRVRLPTEGCCNCPIRDQGGRGGARQMDRIRVSWGQKRQDSMKVCMWGKGKNQDDRSADLSSWVGNGRWIKMGEIRARACGGRGGSDFRLGTCLV